MEDDLPKHGANFVPLSPVSFLRRAAHAWGARPAVLHGARAYTYAELLERARRLASGLVRLGVGRADVVAALMPNIPEMLEAHYGVPMANAVLCPINIRLDAGTIRFILAHSGAKVLLVDREYAAIAARALEELDTPPIVVVIDDPEGPDGAAIDAMPYEALLASGDPSFPVSPPADEWDAISLSYTSGTTGDPKGVVVHHRGAYLNACGNALSLGLSPRSVYLWTLPMFHCNGWTYTWAVTLQGGVHVCLRKVEPARVFALIAEHGVTHLCAAPVVLTMLINAPAEARRNFPHRVTAATGGAAPPSPVIAAMEAMGFDIVHLYGLTECYGPSLMNAWQPGLDARPLAERAAFLARQGVGLPTLEEVAVLARDRAERVPADGATIGEIAIRGNTIMKGYLRNPKANAAVFDQGWFRTGDLGVMHPDGYVEVKDRAKDIVISGGENISSLEVEEVLYAHPKVMEAAVVAHPDPFWGEVPHAFIAPKPGCEDDITAEEIIAFCRDRLAHFKVPRHVTFGPLPKTATGKIQKFALRARLRGEAGAEAAG
ncbi:AMP-binding protein [Elioraea thermophila]|uniref:AMP-binding protein n=1 Tax=Elioraea thermophila TaxID=2185104 RepID=UPI000DF11A81|nr:AMP-binding protein [Elioraea thermophila]